MPDKKKEPVYRNLIRYIQNGFSYLDESVQKEIQAFIASQQHIKGGFTDRAGNPDLYYSLFGLWLSSATNQKVLINKLQAFVQSGTFENIGVIEKLSRVLIHAELGITPDISMASILQIIFKEGRMIDSSYQFFLLFLIIDARGKNKNFYILIARLWLFFYRQKEYLPCSVSAAHIYARKIVGLKIKKHQVHLADYANESGGFKAFKHIKTADMLSTAVALFVLKEINYDIRLVKSACLNFIQDNYSFGAFLSGDGDPTKDLEYTFYGLLALGSLATYE